MNQLTFRFGFCFLATLAIPTATPTFAQQAGDTAPEAVRVLVDGRWTTPEQFASQNLSDPVLLEYEQRRRQAKDTADGNMELARWCKSNGLTDQCDAHLKRVLIHDPDDAGAHKLLNHVRSGQVWLTSQQHDAVEQASEMRNEQWRRWRRPITRIRRQLSSKQPEARNVGANLLNDIRDPRAIFAVERLLANEDESLARQGLDFIAKFPQREATESVLRFAISSPWLTIRNQAIDLLAERNRFDYIPILMQQLSTPYSTEFEIREDNLGNVLYQYRITHKDFQKDNVEEIESVILQNPLNEFGLRSNLYSQTWDRSAVAEQLVSSLNDDIEIRNSHVIDLLASVTGISVGSRAEAWWQWWYDENEVAVYERPVSYRLVRDQEVSQEVQTGTFSDCLVAGTPVWTERGMRPVQSLMIGDRVLCEDVNTRELVYRAVLSPTKRQATKTFRISLQDNDVLQASGGHLFWVEGTGWTKVRDLRRDDRLRTAGQRGTKVTEIKLADSVPLYNLIVDGASNYFVGQNRVLSHDGTIRDQGEESIMDLVGSAVK